MRTVLLFILSIILVLMLAIGVNMTVSDITPTAQGVVLLAEFGVLLMITATTVIFYGRAGTA